MRIFILVLKARHCSAYSCLFHLFPTDSRVLFQIFYHYVKTTPTTYLSPSSTVTFMILKLIERKLDVTMLADRRTQGARWCLKKEREIILHAWKTEAELEEVLSLLESWAAYCFFTQIQSYTEEQPEIRYYVRNRRTARCITCVLMKMPAEALQIFRILSKFVMLEQQIHTVLFEARVRCCIYNQHQPRFIEYSCVILCYCVIVGSRFTARLLHTNLQDELLPVLWTGHIFKESHFISHQ